MPNWTKEQNDAIYQSGQNIIVSAGAGSGKTAVLSERVLQKVLAGTSIDQLLVLTFTKNAALEMKERIRKKLKENNLTSELKKIDNSYITTFDSFSLSLVKKYHYLLNVKKNIDIIESNLLNLKTLEFLDNIMELEYQEKQNDFVKLINDFCIKDDLELKKILLEINNKLNMKCDKEEYLNTYLNKYYCEDVIQKNVQEYLNLIQENLNLMNKELTKLSNEVQIDYFNKIHDVMIPLINSDNYVAIRNNSLQITRLPNLPRGSGEEAKRIKSTIVDYLNKIKELTRYEDEDALIKSIKDTKIYLEAIIRIMQKLDQKINDYKNENDLYDFVDISKMAIRLVKENQNICREIQTFFVEILVDEYQDTSDLQEEFLKMISNNNLYMVGDVKQSIYRFRNANPYIFRTKYNTYAKKQGGIKIDLVKNFRSREEVLNNINLLFESIMTDFIGGANYASTHQMVFGNLSYNEEGKTNQNNNLEIYQYDNDDKLEFKKEEKEAFIIADDILNKVHNHYQIFDKDTKLLRNITFNDCAILIDRSTDFELYKKIFLYKKIPLNIYSDEYLTNSSLFLVIKNIFKLIALIYDKKMNKEVEYTFLSIGRSFLFNYPDEMLFETIIQHNYQENSIFKIIGEIICHLSSKTISQILDEIIDKFEVYEKLRTIKDLENNYIRIDYLYTLAENLNKMGYTFRDFDEYIDDVINHQSDIKYTLHNEDNNSVKIMTIHKSKGLEFPICYYPGLTKKFNEDDIKEKISFDSDLGIITPYYDEGMDHTFYQELMKKKTFREIISEQIRLFYVALTRAKEKMIFVMPSSDDDWEEYENNLVSESIRLEYHSFYDILNSVKSKIKPYMKSINLDNLHLTKDYNLINRHNLFDEMTTFKDKITMINYPIYHVKEKNQEKLSKHQLKIYTKEEKEKMQFGTKLHYYLETMDLKNPDLHMIPLKKDYLTKFLNCDLMKNIEKAKIYQEYAFIDDTNNIMHGVIDLMLEYDDYIDIIDYKLKNIDDEAYLNQIQGYKNYVEKITKKTVHTYLYSLENGVYQEV